MEIRLLGSVGLWQAGREMSLPRSHRRCVLAVLAMTPGQRVSPETLIERVWGSQPPDDVRHSLHTHVSAIRRTLADLDGGAGHAVLRRRDGCYVLEIEPDLIDLHYARRCARQARALAEGTAGQDRQAVEMLREAWSRWRGSPLAGLRTDWALRARTGLEQERLALATERFRLELRIGEHAAAVGPLAELLAEYPLVEPLAGLQMLALYRCGRQAEALETYARTRQRLVDEVGDDPGADLQALHAQVLRRDAALDLDPAAATSAISVAGAASRQVIPAQLPADVAGFTGRTDPLRQLDELLPGTDQDPSTAVVISAIEGTAGIGKTALAVHWAHRVADRFPDGQLYVDLHGFAPGRSPMPPAEAVRGFLDALAVEPHRIPDTPQAQVGLYRTLVADKRMLVVLDNARDSAQVRPLLPAGPGCLALVTSRNQLSGLVATGAHLLELDLLPANEARKLLVNRLGERRVAEQQHAVEQIVDACAGLPLALAMVVARAAARPGLPLTTLAEQLRVAAAGPNPWTGSDPATDVWAVFSTSYHALQPEAARLFRMLGLHPGPDVTVPAAASLAGLSRAQTDRLLTDLTDAHLLSEHAPGRYRFHDLLRAYATDLTHRVDTDADRRTARHRLLDHLVHTAHAAAMLLNPPRIAIRLDPPRQAVEPEDHADLVCASTWLNAERAVLRSAITLATSIGFNAHAWQLAWTVADFLDRQGRWRELKGTQAAALEAARHVANLRAQALAHRGIANACMGLRLDDEAHAHLSQALDLFRSLADRVDQARTQYNLTVLLERSGRHHEALTHGQDALAQFRAEGDVAGQARALNAVGWIHAQLGTHQVTLDHCQQALTLQQDVGDRAGQALSWDSIGYAHHHLTHYPRAEVCYQRALALHREAGDHYHVARTLTHLGDTYDAANRHEAARDAWQEAVTILDGLDHPDAARVHARLQPAV